MAKGKSTTTRGQYITQAEYGDEVIRVNLKLPKKVHARLTAHVRSLGVTTQRYIYELLLAKLDK